MAARAEWMQRAARRVQASLNVTVDRRGPSPGPGLIVCNHLSYLDIVVLAAIQPVVFVAKMEVAFWPVLGGLARCGGTLFLRSSRKSDVARVGRLMPAIIERGVPVVVFPEGTSSDGRNVLPFHSSLLGPTVEHDWPITPVWIGYELTDGSVEEGICYWLLLA